MMLYPEGRGTATHPIEVFGVIGGPRLEAEDDGHTVYVDIYNTEFPFHGGRPGLERSFFLAAGEVAVFRSWQTAEEIASGDDHCVIQNVDRLDESCYGAPNYQGGLRVLNPDRANYEAYMVSDTLDSGDPSVEELYRSEPGTEGAGILAESLMVVRETYIWDTGGRLPV